MLAEKEDLELVLGIETSTQSGGAAIAANGEIIGVVKFHIKKTHSFRELECINFLFSELEISAKDLKAIAVSIGPGSFTGVRIGLSIAKGLSYSSNKPLIGVSCLESLALRIAEPQIILCPVIDANRGEIFAQLFIYDLDNNTVFPFQNYEPFLGTVKEFLPKIPNNALLAGNGAKRYCNEILLYNKNCRFASPNKMYPTPEEIALIGYTKFKRNQFDDPALLEPIYLRKATNVLPSKNQK